ncbi:MAG: hypothetical protein K6G22_08035 [Lachnospiraceae bacterium]|nr:hypothetical protein [Lachnospiraceae bacterium]
MGTVIKKCINLIICFIISAALMTGLLVLSAMIPREKIEDRMLESAEFLYKSEIFGKVIKDVIGSTIDRYADAILLNIAYHYDPDDLLRSVMSSSYYFSQIQEECENLLEAVKDDKEANQQYLRYWHGSNLIVRPLHMFLSIRQIYVLNAVLLVLLFGFLEFLLIRKRQIVPAVGLPIALILTSSFFVPLSLEYTWIFIVMFTSSIIVVLSACKESNAKKDSTGKYAYIFLITGMVTSFLDFLTAETLTLTIPLLILLYMMRVKDGFSVSASPQIDGNSSRTDSSKSIADKVKNLPVLYKTSIEAALCWGAGYVCMWVLKWVLGGIVLSENVMPYVSEHVSERLGDTLGLSKVTLLLGAVTRNIGCMFPIGYGVIGAVAGLILVIFVAYVMYVYHRNNTDRQWILLCIFIGLIPYVRYLVLRNHSFLHCFFTCRAQAATVLAVLFIVSEVTGVNDIRLKKGFLIREKGKH